MSTATANLSIYAIPIFYILILAPHAYAVGYIKRANKGRYDSANAHGQKFQTAIQKTVPPEILARYERAERAHKNGFETFGPFAASVICGNMAHLDPKPLNVACGIFLLARAVHTVAYINTTNPRYAYFRSVVWGIGVFCCLYLLVKAGNVMATSGR